MMHAGLVVLALIVVTLAPDPALAYIGPGAGLGMIGSLVAVLGAVVLALVGLFVLPFRMLMKRRKEKASDEQKAAMPASSTQDG
jgi:hypothetical protein